MIPRLVLALVTCAFAAAAAAQVKIGLMVSATDPTSAIGVQGVWVNGVRVAGKAGSVDPGRLPGRVLREFTA